MMSPNTQPGAVGHHGRRRGHAAVPADQGAREARGAAGRQVPARRHPDLQLHQLRPAAHLPADAVQLGVAPPAHRAVVQVRPLLRAASSRSSPPSRRTRDTSWYQGTADAVRKNLVHLLNHDFDYVLILSGDQLYRMDFRPLIAQHIETRRGPDHRHDPGAPARRAGAGHHADRRASAASRASSRSRRTRPCSTSLAMPPALYAIGSASPGDGRTCSSPRWASTSSTATCCIDAARQRR